MSEVVQIEELRARREQNRLTVIAVEESLYAFLPHDELRRWRRREPAIRYVPLGSVPEGLKPDLVIGPYLPSGPGLRLLAQTLESRYELDEAGHTYRDTELLWSEPLTAVGSPRSWLPGQLRLGEEMALLFSSREADGWHFRVYVTESPVVIAGDPPARASSGFVPRDWLVAALEAIPGAAALTS